MIGVSKMRYFYFVYATYYPTGGASDFVSSHLFFSDEEAKEFYDSFLKLQLDEYSHGQLVRFDELEDKFIPIAGDRVDIW
jgi:hypothetical protein